MTGKTMNAVARGGAVFAVGAAAGQALQLVTGIIVIRYIEKGEYGLITLAYVTVNLLVTIALVGLGSGLPRFIARSRERGELTQNLGVILGSAGSMTIVSCLFLGGACFVFAEDLAALINKPGLTPVLRVFAALIPGLALVQFLTAAFQGIQRAAPRAIFQESGVKGLRLLLVLVAISLGLGLQGVVYAFLGSVLLTLVAYMLYARKYLFANVRLSVRRDYLVALLAFSAPLVGVAVANQMAEWTGTMVLGFTQPAEEVARYMAPTRLTAVILLPLTALGFIYSPVAARLSVSGDIELLDSFYRTTTKWIVIATIPFVTFLIVDAEYVVTLLFGPSYQDSAPILMVVAAAYGIHVLFGPNTATLISCGNSATVFRGTLISSLTAVAVCLALIPRYGAIGAALGTTTSLIVLNLIMSGAVLRHWEIHSLHHSIMVPAGVALAAGLGAVFLDLSEAPDLIHLGLFLLIYTLTMMAPIVFRTLDATDLELLGAVERRIGVRPVVTAWLRKWLSPESKEGTG